MPGLAIRLLLVAAVTPWVQAHWFNPFLSHMVAHPSLDPWMSFLAAGGDPVSFPYGPGYVAAFLPAVLLGDMLLGSYGAALGLRIGILTFDVVMLFVIRCLTPGEARNTSTAIYWLSPVGLYINYWHGQLDVLPALILVSALMLLRDNRFIGSSAAFAAACGAKFSMALALPFVGLYLLGAGRLARVRLRMAGVLLAGLTLVMPFAFSSGFRSMVLGTRETARLFSLAIPVQAGIELFVLPVVLLALFYVLWRVRRLNLDMLMSATGAGFLCLILLTPPTPGWAMWALPFLTLHVARFGGSAWGLGSGFSLFFLLYHLTTSTGASMFGVDLSAPLTFADTGADGRARSILYSLYFMFGSALLVQMLWRGVFSHAFYLATRKPFVIGIAGDSGAGKDTLADALVDLFGPTAVCRISGDDYHNWDRNKPMWRALTHLNPRSNDLARFDADIHALASGRHIRSRHYDHTSGSMTKPRSVRSREVIVASALHALHVPTISAPYDVRIFLEMDEGLRRHFKLRRDVSVRGHSVGQVLESIDRRAADGDRFIRPQRNNADVILGLNPVRSFEGADPTSEPGSLRLRAKFAAGVNNDALERVLTALCGLNVSCHTLPDGSEELTVSGEPTEADIAAAARSLAPDFVDHLALEPIWRAGQTGVMQLILLGEISRAAVKRGLKI